MDAELLEWLASPAGAEAFAQVEGMSSEPLHAQVLALRERFGAARAAALLEQADLRRRAARKLPFAAGMLLDRDALEQATPWEVATERTAHWPDDAVLHDLGAGLGVDAMAAAERGLRVIAYERDPLRARLLALNAHALGFADRLEVRCADLAEAAGADASAFLDPDRRPGGHRTRDAAAFSPPVGAWPEIAARFARLMIKGPPVLAPEVLPEARREYVSLRGRLRECRVRLGDWPTDAARRSACALPGGARVAGTPTAWPVPAPPRVGAWVLDADPALVAADLLGVACADHGLRPLHARIACLQGDEPAPGVPGAWIEVQALLPVRPRKINAWLAAADIGQVEVHTRGVDRSAEDLRRGLRPAGRLPGALLFTRDLEDRWICLAGRRLVLAAGDDVPAR